MSTSKSEPQQRADVLIVGAGPSGGVVGRRLAEAGFRVVCLEQGYWPDPATYPGQKPEYELLSRKQWSGSPNVRALAEDYPVDDTESDIAPLMFNGVGGSLIIFAGDWCRARPSDFRVRTLDGVGDDWPISYEDLQPHFERTDIEFDAAGLGGDPALPPGADPPFPPLPIGRGALRVARAHDSLGWHWWPGTNSVVSVARAGKRPCVQWGCCMQGCPEGAKATPDLTHWPVAIAHGAQVITGARVTRIVVGPDGLATGVEYITLEGEERLQEADVVVLAANAVGTARLLLLSAQRGHPDGLANGSGLVGRRLMMHPFGNVTGVFDEDLESWRGHVGAKIVSYQFYETDASRGFVRGAKWSLAPTGGPVNAALPTRAGASAWGPGHHAHVRERLGRSVSWGIFGEDLPDPENRIVLDPVLKDSSGLPAPKFYYRVSENSRRLLDFHIDRASESLQQAGAFRIDVERLMRYSGWHLLGTARMGTDPATSVVDEWGRCHEVANLYVVDGSVFVTSAGVNPTGTIVAFASRVADRLIETRRDQEMAK